MKHELQETLAGLDEWLAKHQTEMIADISELVAIPSVYCPGEDGTPFGAANAEVIRRMGQLAERYGFEWHEYDRQCVSVSYGKGEKQLGIWGHLDVVAVEAADWQFTQPFECVQIKNFLFGRGVQDNKGPGVGSLYLLRYLKENGIVPPFEIRLIYGSNEETSMKDVDAYLQMEKAPDLSFVPDCGFPVCYGEKGFLEVDLLSPSVGGHIIEAAGGQAINAIPSAAHIVVDGKVIEAEGVGGHSAYPAGTVNALGVLGKKCLELAGLTVEERKLFQFLADAGEDSYGEKLGVARADEPSGPMTCAPTLLSMEGGCVKVSVNIRYPITMKGRDILADLEKAAADYGLTLRVGRDSAPNWEDPHGKWASFLTDVFADVTGERQEPYVMGGGTYARRIPNTVGFGPGLPKEMAHLHLPQGHGECHQPDESQCLDTLFLAWKIYMCTLLRLIERGLPLNEKGGTYHDEA